MLLVVVLALIIAITTAAVLGYKLTHPKYDGVLVLVPAKGKTVFSFEVSTDPDIWTKKKFIVLEVANKPPEESRE